MYEDQKTDLPNPSRMIFLPIEGMADLVRKIKKNLMEFTIFNNLPNFNSDGHVKGADIPTPTTPLGFVSQLLVAKPPEVRRTGKKRKRSEGKSIDELLLTLSDDIGFQPNKRPKLSK